MLLSGTTENERTKLNNSTIQYNAVAGSIMGRGAVVGDLSTSKDTEKNNGLGN